jgi:hypothetical protein
MVASCGQLLAFAQGGRAERLMQQACGVWVPSVLPESLEKD